MGRFDESIAAGRRAEELDPLSPIISADTGANLFKARRFDEAIAQFNRTLGAEDRQAAVAPGRQPVRREPIHPHVAAGPIAAQQAFPIGPEDDAGAVYARSAEVAANLLRELDGFDFHEQEGEPTYAQKLESSDRELDLTDPDDALRRVRALSPHIGARTELHGRPLTIWKARIDDGKLVPVEVQPSGGRRMTYEEFLRGLR